MLENFLSNVISNYKKINKLYPFFNKLYPIGIAEFNTISIYEYNEITNRYEYAKKVTMKKNFSDRTAASFPVQEFKYKACCILGKEIVKSKINMIYVFHEFVHCYQYENYEMLIKKELNIDKMMWDIYYNFDYSNKYFIKYYLKSVLLLEQNMVNDSILMKQELFEKLNLNDIKYITFYEWKEGYARYYENTIRKDFGIKENHYYNYPNLDSTIFYEYGSLYFNAIYKKIEKNLYEVYKNLSHHYLQPKV